MDEAAAQRRVFLVRLAAWGTVLVLAVLAFTLRSGASGRTVEQGANGDQVNGLTSQRVPIWAVVGDGRVRELRMAWRFDCDSGGDLDPVGITLRDSVDGFEFRGREFSYEDERDFPPSEDGWVATVKVSVSGRLSEGRGVQGESSAVMRFNRGSEPGATCRSGDVSWSAR